MLLKEGPLGFAALGGCSVFLVELRSLWVFAQVAGFHLNDCIEYFIDCPLLAICPSGLLPKFQPKRKENYDLFSQSRQRLYGMEQESACGKM